MTRQPAIACEYARLALSAQLDGEDPGTPAGRVTAHLDSCPACRAWLTRAEQVNRAVRLQPARVPDLTEAILAAVAADPAIRTSAAAATAGMSASGVPSASAGPSAAGGRELDRSVRQSRQRVLQLATVAIAVVQLLLALPALFGTLGLGLSPHAAHELGSFDAALAVGFLVAGVRPAWARGYTPVAAVLAVCLTVTSGLDAAHQQVSLLRETGHLVVVGQALLLWALARTAAAGRTPPSGDTAVRTPPARATA